MSPDLPLTSTRNLQEADNSTAAEHHPSSSSRIFSVSLLFLLLCFTSEDSYLITISSTHTPTSTHPTQTHTHGKKTYSKEIYSKKIYSKKIYSKKIYRKNIYSKKIWAYSKKI